MDKNEYKLKLDEIERAVDTGDYAEAVRLADQIDWKRVRNVRTLCLISEIYEAENRYEDSKALLLRAYRRTPVGRAILYRLVEVTIRLKQFDEAIEYYSEYVQAAPNDTSRYILKYKIYRGRGSSVEEQIEVLKEYLDQEYTEKYAYELARLYQEADRISECLTTVDDLVLWFHSGKYVTKALELKMKYAPLTPKQQEIYDHRFDEKEEDPIGQEKQIVSTQQTTLAESIVEDTTREIASEVAQAAADLAGEEADGAGLDKTQVLHSASQLREAVRQGGAGGDAAEADIAAEAEQGVAAETDIAAEAEQGVAAETDIAAEAEQGVAAEADIAPDRSKAEGSGSAAGGNSAAGGMENRQDTADRSAAGPNAAPGQGAQEDEAALDEPMDSAEQFDEELSRYNTQELQTEMVRSMREIVSGVGVRDLLDVDREEMDRVIELSKQDQEEANAAENSRLNLSRRLTLPELQRRREAGQLSIDDVLSSMGERGSAVREAAARVTAPVRPQPEGVLSAVDEALLNMGVRGIVPEPSGQRRQPEANPTVPGAQEKVSGEPEEIEENEEALGGQTVSRAAAEQVPGDTIVLGIREDALKEAERISEEKQENKEETVQAEKPAAGDTIILEPQRKTPAAPEEKIESREASGRQAVSGAPDAGQDSGIEDIIAAQAPDAGQDSGMEDIVAAQAPDADMEDTVAVQVPDAGMEDTIAAQAPDAGQDMSMEDIISAQTRRIPTEEIASLHESAGLDRTADETSGEAEAERERLPQEQPAASQRWLKAPLRGFFEGYLDIPDLDRQIASAVDQAMRKGTDRTSRTGNVLIFGGHGCGKTTIATGLAKAIAQEQGRRFVKMAKIYATDLNRKDIAATVAKIAGGVLIVEEAGDLDDNVADQLTTAMEFRTDGLILILEDEQKYMHDLLMRHPRLTMKFTSQIYIPAFSAEELLGFARLYADERDYNIGEDAGAALRARLGAMYEAGETLSITSALDLADKAIARANGFGRKLFSGKKRYDSEGRVVLLEKDFR